MTEFLSFFDALSMFFLGTLVGLSIGGIILTLADRDYRPVRRPAPVKQVIHVEKLSTISPRIKTQKRYFKQPQPMIRKELQK